MQVALDVSQVVEPAEHLVQFYDAGQAAWVKGVGRYLAEGLKQGDALLVITTPQRNKDIVRQLRTLGCDPESAESHGRLTFRDATAMLAAIMVAGEPDWDQFKSALETEMTRLRPSPGGGLRAYGEMVGILWSEHEFSAAIRLEEYWNRLLRTARFKLFCGYPIDVFTDDFNHSRVDAVLCAHTHLVSTGEDGDLREAVTRAIDDSARRYYQNEKRFRALIENSTDAISLFDRDANITYASASATRVLGYQPRELVGRNALDLVHPDDLEMVQSTIDEVRVNPRSPIKMRARLVRKDHQWCWVESTLTNLIDDPDVRAVVANYRDITQQKAAEEKQMKDAEELARYNAELQSFAYAATHDLREPLRTVSAFTELLVQRSGSDPESRQYAKFIVDSVAHMSRMLDDLLSLTSLSSRDEPQRVDLRRAVDQAIKNLEQAIRESEAGISIGPLPWVLGNESQLTGLIQNLLGNAIKYRGPDPARIQVSAEPLGSEWVVRVRDNGIGIAPAYHKQIFGLFKRLHHRSVSGTGIGLAICKKIVDGMGGKIWVESEPGQGSTFCFTARSVARTAE